MSNDKFTDVVDREYSGSSKQSDDDLRVNYAGLGRRDFLKRLGGGVVVLFTTGPAFFEELARAETVRGATPPDFNAYLRIGADGRVTCFTGKIEMGQGIHTSLAQMLAEELDVALDDVDMVMGDTDRCPYDRGTWGSLSTRVFGPELRAAGAEARAVLLELASEHLDVPVDRLRVREGVVYDVEDQARSVRYAELTRGREVARELSREAAVKAVEDFKVMGRSFNRKDARAKVTGAAEYAADIRLPGMLIARILRPPAHGAVLRSVDTSAAEAMEGVTVVRLDDLIAVLHPKRDVAEAALDRIEANFDVPEAHVDKDSIFDHLLNVAPAPETVAGSGTVEKGIQLASKTHEATYLDGYVAHAPMEPHAAVAQMEDGRMTVWASTQNPFGLKDEVARALGLPTDQVRVITPFVGGGFGGKSANRQAVEAARLAHHTGTPVQVAWSREEEFFYDTFRPAAIVKVHSGVTDVGDLAFWDYHVYFAGQRGGEHFYDIPHDRTRVSNSSWVGPPGSHPFATGAWRAPAANTNGFARESHIDMMASMAGVDPLDFRLRHLSDEKITGVLRAAGDRFGWTAAKTPSGRGFGVACGVDADTVVAAMAEVTVDEQTGHVRVERMVCAQDMGLVVNPDGAKMQIEGCLTMGLGYALSEEIHFSGGAIHDRNFGSYQLPLFSWLPEIEAVLVDSGDTVPHGGGEPAIITVGAVIGNAIFDATGARLYRMPMTPDRVRAALG